MPLLQVDSALQRCVVETGQKVLEKMNGTKKNKKKGRKNFCTKEIQECLRVQKNTKVRKSEF